MTAATREELETMTTTDDDEALECLERLSEQLDYSLVQEGGDLSFRRSGAKGYHYTSSKSLVQIRQDGLGRHPGRSIEEHEVAFWIVMPFIAQDAAARLAVEHEAGRNVEAALEDLLRQEKELRVVWFYRKEDMGGRTAKHREECVQFDLGEVGDWLAENTESPHEFGDEAGGYAVAWLGPPIPTRLLSGCDETVFGSGSSSLRGVSTREELETLAKAYRAAEDETHSERAQKMIDAEVRRVEASFDELSKKIAISFVQHDPYASFAEMKARVLSERRLLVWTGGSDTPLWEPIHNWKARAVHDWDHIQHGLDFSMEGEAGAYRVSAARMPELAPLYLSEIALQAAVVNFSKAFAPQKFVLVAPKIERIVRELRGLRLASHGSHANASGVLLVVWFVYGLYERGATDEEVMLHLRAADMSAGTALPIALAAKKLHEGRRMSRAA